MSYTPRDVLLSFELMPPRSEKAQAPFAAILADILAVQPDFVSVTYGAGGKDRNNARALVQHIVNDTPVSPIAHITSVAATRAEVTDVISDYLDTGVRTFLAVRGDPPVTDPDWVATGTDVHDATELIGLIRSVEKQKAEAIPGAALRRALRPLTIAVGAFMDGNGITGTTVDQEVVNLLKKQEMGATFAITQLFWSADTYVNFVEKARAEGVSIPIVPGIMPPTQMRRVLKAEELSGVKPPQWLVERLSAGTTEEEVHAIGVEIGAQLVRDLLDYGVNGVHMFTFNKSQPSLDILRAAGLV
ncbi:MAG: methylenetetrahydrofolate reductase [Corynebacterium sp.]|nr:methylenetetrahydrofolate reductase [Corynebacterium sp.]